MEEKDVASFSWKTNLHKNTAYPIDYNLSSLKNRDASFKTGFVNQRTWKNSLFNEIFRFVVHPDYFQNKGGDNKPGIITVPVELETFFYTYLRTHLQYKESHDRIFKYEIDEQPEFLRELCWELYQEISKDTWEDSYLSRSLCTDLFWRNTIADDLWDKEISERVCRMRELKSRISAEKRLQLLMNIMSYLDTQIMEMALLSEDCQQEYKESFLKVFPLTMIQKTRNLPSKDPVSHDACFNIPDIMLKGDNDEIQKLSDAFTALKDTLNNEDMKYATRKAYLDAVKERIETNEFYNACREYQDYSLPIPTLDANTRLEDIIRKRCIHYFSSIVRGNPYIPGTYAMDQESLDLYQHNLQFRHIENTICKQYNAFVAKEWSTIAMVSSDNYHKLAEAFRINPSAMLKYFTDSDSLINTGKTFAESIIPFIKQVWPKSIPCATWDKIITEDRFEKEIIPQLIEKVAQIYVDWKIVPGSKAKDQLISGENLFLWWSSYCNLYHGKATVKDYLTAYLGVQFFLQCLYTIKVAEQTEEICSQVCSQMKQFEGIKDQ